MTTNRAATMDELVDRMVPNSTILSTSNPTPRLRAINVVGLYHDEHRARDAVLALEDIESDDAAIGVTVVADTPPGGGVDGPDRRANDRQGPIDEMAPRTLEGAAIGAVAGAILVGGVVALIDSSLWIGAAIGGAIFGGIVGAIWGAFARMGGSDAYRQTFVETAAPTTTVVSLHSDDPTKAEEARRRLALQADAEPTVVRVVDGRIQFAEPGG